MSAKQALAVIAAVLEAPTNRYGKPEFYTDEARAAREELRKLAVRYNVNGAESILHQAAQVARAALSESVRA